MSFHVLSLKVSARSVCFRKTLLCLFALANHHPTQLTFQITLEFPLQEAVPVAEKVCSEQIKRMTIFTGREIINTVSSVGHKYLENSVVTTTLFFILKMRDHFRSDSCIIYAITTPQRCISTLWMQVESCIKL